MRELKWVLFNVAFLTLMYFGFMKEVTGALNVVYVLTWVSIVASFCTLSETVKIAVAKEYKNIKIPKSLSWWVNLLIVGVFAWYGAIVTAIFYFIAVSLYISLRKDIEDGKVGKWENLR